MKSEHLHRSASARAPPTQRDGRRGRHRAPTPGQTPTAGFPQRCFTAKEAETPAGAGPEGRGIAAPNAPSGQPDPTKAGEHRLHAPSPPRPKSSTRETPFLSRTPRGPKAMQPKAPPTRRGGGAGPQPRALSASPSRPFLHHRTRAGPASDRRDEGPPLRAHRDYALLPLPHGVRPRSAPHSHAREAEVSPPEKHTPSSPRLPATQLPGGPRRGVLSPQKLQPLSLRVPPGVSLAPSTEAPERRGHRPARADWQPPLRSRSGHRPGCPDWEGGREGGKL